MFNNSNNFDAGMLKEVAIGDNSIIFCWCPPGSFLMGSPEFEQERMGDEKQHLIVFTTGFWIQQTPFTQKQYSFINTRVSTPATAFLA